VPVLHGIRVSSLYRTSPQDYPGQDDFLNLAVAGVWEGSPRELLCTIQSVETRYGRDRTREIPKGPRTLDIDVELFGSCIIGEPGLVIPHERMHIRQFVLVPLLELFPDSADPVSGRPYREICDSLPDQGVVKVGTLNGC